METDGGSQSKENDRIRTSKIWRNYHDGQIGLQFSNDGKQVELIGQGIPPFAIDGPACGFTLDRWDPVNAQRAPYSLASYAERHPWRRMGYHSTFSCTLSDYSKKRFPPNELPFNITKIFLPETNDLPLLVPAGLYRIRFREITREGTIEITLRITHKKSVEELLQTVRSVNTDIPANCRASKRALVYRLREQLDRESVRYIEDRKDLDDSHQMLFAWALSERPDLWKHLGDSPLQDSAVESLMARHRCGCFSDESSNFFGLIDETNSSLNPEIQEAVRTSIRLADGFSVTESNLVQEFWPYVSHDLLMRLIRRVPKFDAESRLRVWRAVEGFYSQVVPSSYVHEWDPSWRFATQEPRSLGFLSKCAVPSTEPWQDCSITRITQANLILSEIEMLADRVENSHQNAALRSLRNCLVDVSTASNKKEMSCETSIQARPSILDGILPDWATDAEFGDDDSCEHLGREELLIPTSTNIEVRSFQVLEY